MSSKSKKNGLGLEERILIKVLKMYRKQPCLWDSTHKYYHHKSVKNAAWEKLLQLWRKCTPHATLHDVKIKVFHMRTNYTRQRKKAPKLLDRFLALGACAVRAVAQLVSSVLPLPLASRIERCATSLIDMLHREILYKFIKQFQKSDCLWNRNHASYYNKSAKEDALFALLIICKEYEHTTLEDVKRQIQNLRAVYRRYRKKVESSASASINYKPTLWYYKHLTFLSGNAEPDSDESDSDNNDDNESVEPPRGQKRPAGTSIGHQGEEAETSVDESATAFGTSVGAQLHQLSKMQRCIAEKLISEVIYHAKMEQLSMNTSINVKGASDAEVLIPKAGPSWYDTNTIRDTDTRVQEPTSSTVLTSEEQAKKEIDETESAVSFIKMESYDTEDYVIHDEDPCIEITKEELM